MRCPRDAGWALFDIGEIRPVDGAVEDPGRGQASHPQRCEKRTGLPPGARRVVERAPRRARPYRRRRLFVMPVSSRKTRRVGSQVGAAACHTTRAAATSGRSCSEGRTVFLTVTSRAATARQIRQTGRRASASFSSAKVRSGCSAKGCAGASNIRRRPCRWTRGATARLPPTLSTAAPTTRSRGTHRRPRPIPASTPFSEIHRIGLPVLLHWCMQKYHDEPKQYKGYLKSALKTESHRTPRRCVFEVFESEADAVESVS